MKYEKFFKVKPNKDIDILTRQLECVIERYFSHLENGSEITLTIGETVTDFLDNKLTYRLSTTIQEEEL